MGGACLGKGVRHRGTSGCELTQVCPGLSAPGRPPAPPQDTVLPAAALPPPVTPSRFLLRTGSQGAGPRCWPGFWSNSQSPWYVFSNGTELIILGKWLSPPFLSHPTPPACCLRKVTLLSLWAASLCPPALHTDPHFLHGRWAGLGVTSKKDPMAGVATSSLTV